MVSSIRRAVIIIILFISINSSLVTAQSNSNINTMISFGSIISSSNNAIQLRTEGTQIVDGNGEPFRILSMTIGQNERLKQDGTGTSISNTPRTDPYESWFTPDDVDFYKSIGYNTLEIHMMTLKDVSKADGSINQAYFRDYIDEWVKWGTEKELYVILNFQRFNPLPGSFDSYGWYYVPNWFYADYGYPSTFNELSKICIDFYDTTVTHMNDERENYYKLLEYTANRYKDNPWVMISPRNEPQHFIYRYTENEAQGQRIVDGYYEIATESIDRMRATGFNGLTFVELPYGLTNYDGRVQSAQNINRQNVVFEIHYYMSNNNDFNLWKEKVSLAKEKIDSFNKPMYLGEWGLDPMEVKDIYGLEYSMNLMLNYLDSNNMNSAFHAYGRIWGYANWSANPENKLSSTEIEIMENIMIK